VGTKYWRTAVGIPKIDSVETLPQKTSFNVLFDEIFDVSVDTRTGVNETKTAHRSASLARLRAVGFCSLQVRS
jgi:hypothetical protein